jgi:uncharacterized protein (DUF927 family)
LQDPEKMIESEIYAGEIKKSLESCPESLDTLLSAETVDNLFKLDELTRERMIATLRKYAQSKKISLKSFDSMIQAAKRADKYANRSDREDGAENSGSDIPASKPINIPGIPLAGLTEPGDWMIDKTGRIIKMTPNENILACPHPVIISARLRNVDFNDEKLAVSFYRDKHWSNINVSRSTAGSRTSIVSLADSGIQVNSENSKDLVTYLYELETCNSDVIPCKKSVGRLGWIGNHDFFPYDSSYTFDGDGDDSKEIVSAVCSAGDYEAWKTNVSQFRQYHPLVRAFLGASFSSPLLKMLGKLCYCIHIWGKSGTAKTVAIYAAMSIWGSPETLTQSFSGTQVGFEKMAALYSSIPLALDERETAKAGAGFDGIIYQLTEGKSKLRGSKRGGLQPVYHWKIPILTNGEYPIISENSKSGARNRTIELNCSEPLFNDPVAAANLLKTNYGFAGEQWIKYLQDEKIQDLTNLYNIFYEKLGEDQAHEDKQIASLSMIVLSDYLSSIEIFGMDSAQAEREAMHLGKTLLSMIFTRDEVDQTNSAWSYILDWITKNQAHFDGREIDPWGVMDGNSDIYVLSSEFANALKSGGYDSPRGIAQGFRDKGFLIPYEKDNRLQCQRWLFGRNIKCYHLRIKAE